MTYYKILITIVILLFSATFVSADVVINEENFPDEVFRGWIISQEYGKDGVLTDEEISGITNIWLYYKEIQSLKGIEHFTALVELECSANQLTSLDVSKNVVLKRFGCGDNKLNSIDVSKNTMLEVFSCAGNILTSIDLSKNTMLKELNCRDNLISSLDVSQNSELVVLRCNENQLTSLDVSNCPKLRDLYCMQNNLRTLNVSGCEKLEQINCFKNQIKGEAMDAFIDGLRSFDGPGHLAIVSLENEQNVMTTSQAKAARAKGWIPRYEYGSFGTHGWTEYKGEDDATGIGAIADLPSKKRETFDLQGRRISKAQKGINIIRNADGTSKKVLIKH